MENDKLPFKVGQLAEAKSFETGYRGAWFRCKIHKIDGSNGYIRHALEYIDFPDEKKRWTKIYQLPSGKKKKRVGMQLIMRPQYPYRYNEIQIPVVGMIMEATADRITEVTVSVDDTWKVGDLVDWWSDDCYWSGSLTQLLGKGKATITLLQSPEGEGGSYEVYCKDLRPSLDWSPEDGWRVPTSKEGDNCISFDRLIQQFKQGKNNTKKADVGLLTYDIHSMEVSNDVENKAGSPVNASLSSHISANSISASDKSDPRKTGNMWEPLSITVPKMVTETPEGNGLDMRDSSIGKPSLSDSVSSSHMKKYASAETAVHTAGKDLYDSAGSMKKLKTGGSIPLNIMFSEILDLEELANKVQWLKDILEFGVPLSNGVKPPWKFVEHRASSTPK